VGITDRSAKPLPGPQLTALAKALDKLIPGAKALPAQLSLLPADGRKARSERYHHEGFLSRSFLSRAFSAEYEGSTGKGRAFVLDAGSTAQAAAVVEKLVAAGKKHKKKALAQKPCYVIDGCMHVAATGSTVKGVVCSEGDEASARALTVRLLER
jgi:hypothetical protein